MTTKGPVQLVQVDDAWVSARTDIHMDGGNCQYLSFQILNHATLHRRYTTCGPVCGRKEA